MNEEILNMFRSDFRNLSETKRSILLNVSQCPFAGAVAKIKYTCLKEGGVVENLTAIIAVKNPQHQTRWGYYKNGLLLHTRKDMSRHIYVPAHIKQVIEKEYTRDGKPFAYTANVNQPDDGWRTFDILNIESLSFEDIL